jgi:UDP:flavonoid glycosyltransferase YjiC (YdhE family)
LQRSSGETNAMKPLTQAVRRILDDARYTERVRAISKRLQAEGAVSVACAELEKFLTSAAQKSIH